MGDFFLELLTPRPPRPPRLRASALNPNPHLKRSQASSHLVLPSGFLDGFLRISRLTSAMARSICGSHPAA